MDLDAWLTPEKRGIGRAVGVMLTGMGGEAVQVTSLPLGIDGFEYVPQTRSLPARPARKSCIRSLLSS